MLKIQSLLLLFILVSLENFSQTIYPNNYFSPPVKTKLTLTGNFGEIRKDHFHAGLDIKTEAKEGIPVYSIAEGYISRIKISAFGYGNALYITHPNGYTSVYAHLKDFKLPVQQYALNIQYRKESFEIDTLLTENLFKIQKDEFIGNSGNSGSSQGPHLHFEIRDTKTEKPINPLYFGYQVPDKTPPVIKKIIIYPLDSTTQVNGKYTSTEIIPKREEQIQFIERKDSVVVFGNIGIGVNCYDTDENSKNQNNVFSIELQSGGKRIYYYQMESFAFNQTKYVNAHIDYSRKKEMIQKCFLSKNNKIDIYKDIKNNGFLKFDDERIHWMRLIVKDFAGNENILMFKIRSEKPIVDSLKKTQAPPGIFMDCLIDNSFKEKDLEVLIPALSLYDDTYFSFSKITSEKFTLSPIYQLGNNNIALHKNISIKIKTPEINDTLKNKLCIALIPEKTKPVFCGGTIENEWIKGESKSFGLFTLLLDTLKPEIKPAFKVPESNTIDIEKIKKIQFYITDNLSGVKSYKATLNNKWVLLEHDAKNALFTLILPDNIEQGKHELTIIANDDKQNITTKTYIIKK